MRTGLEKKNDDCKGDIPPPLKSPETGFYSGFNSATSETVPQDFLRKYLSHARDTCQPRLHSIDQDKISRLYADLRRESALCGGVPIAVRHLESLMRMAEAHVVSRRQDFGAGVDGLICRPKCRFVNMFATTM